MMRSTRIVFGAAILLLVGASLASAADAEERSGLTVVILEPLSGGVARNQIGFSLSLGGSRFETGDNILDALAEARGTHLAILLREDLPMSGVLTLVSLASKAGYLEYSLIVFDRKRKGMALVPSFRWIDFSVDPKIVGELVR